MYKKYKSKYGIALFALLAPFFVGWLSTSIININNIDIHNSVANITNNLSEEPINLKGVWEFYPEQSYELSELPGHSAERKYIYFPGNMLSDNNFYSNPGTYHLTINTDKKYDELALYSPHIPRGAKLSINGEFVKSHSSQVKFTALHFSNNEVFDLPPIIGNRIDIVITSGGLSYFDGVFSSALFLGERGIIYSLKTIIFAATMMFITICVFSLLVFAGKSINNNRERSLTWLIVFITSHLGIWLWFFLVNTRKNPFSMETNYKLTLIWVIVNLVYLCRYLWINSGKQYIKKFTPLITSSASFCVLALILPQNIAVYALLIWGALILMVTLFVLYRLIYKDIFGWQYFSFGFGCVSVILATELAWINGYITSSIIAATTILIFVTSQTLLISEIHKKNYEKEKYNNLQMQYCRTQIRPHFIYNVLASISTLIIEDSKTARLYLKHFSVFLRQIFDNNQENTTTPLTEEIELIEQYLFLENIRYQAKLKYQILLCDNVDRFSIPPFSLQTIVENCIVHGALKNGLPEYIVIELVELEDYCSINISNNGSLGVNIKALNESLQGISRVGLFNVKLRIEALKGSLSYNINGNRLIFNLMIRRNAVDKRNNN